MDNVVFQHCLSESNVYVRDAIIGRKYVDYNTGKMLGILSYKRYCEPIRKGEIGTYRCKFSHHNSIYEWNDILTEIL